MSIRLISGFAAALLWAMMGVASSPALAQTGAKAPRKPSPPRVFTRILYEDQASQKLRWANFLESSDKKITLEGPFDLKDFPKLDVEKQRLVQVQASQGLVVVGVRDEEEGDFASGWVLIDSGVRYKDHGDHGHWIYRDDPRVLDSRIDEQQGNPAHVYCYDGCFYLANDRKNGYTRIDPADYLAKPSTPKATFFPGGGNHITLAVARGKVGYSAWIDGGGPNNGRVDVTRLGAESPSEPNYSFHLPSGVIHGAATAAGKVFFAPSEGLAWVAVDETASLQPEQVQIHQIELGEQEGKPLRTGAFAQHESHLLCVAGKGAASKLVIVDASAPQPSPVLLSLQVKEGSQATPPRIFIAADKKPYALIFHDHEEDSENEDQLDLFALDPNGDGKFADAAFLKSIPVGQSEVDGHFGHHSAAFDAQGRYALIVNPGDATLQVIATASWSEIACFSLGGKPADIVAIGGK